MIILIDLRLFKEDAEHNETIIESKECVLTLPTQPDNILINGILFLTALKVIIFSGSDSYVIEYLCSIYRDVRSNSHIKRSMVIKLANRCHSNRSIHVFTKKV